MFALLVVIIECLATPTKKRDGCMLSILCTRAVVIEVVGGPNGPQKASMYIPERPPSIAQCNGFAPVFFDNGL